MFAESTFIKQGVWNRIRIDADVIRNGAPSVLGRYLMLDHPEEGSEPAWNDTALGQVIGYSVIGPDAALKVKLNVWENRISRDILDKLQNGGKLPVSSGHLAFHKEEAGTFESKPYSAVATKIYFEHIALVPVGACSPEDGCSLSIQQAGAKAIKDVQCPRSAPNPDYRGNHMTWPQAKARIRKELGVKYI